MALIRRSAVLTPKGSPGGPGGPPATVPDAIDRGSDIPLIMGVTYSFGRPESFTRFVPKVRLDDQQ